MPTGRIKFYDSAKGFGFAQTDEGDEVHVPSTALPRGVTELAAGTRVEFGVAEGRRGKQALSLRLLDSAPSVVRNHRPKPEEMAVLMEDLIRWLDQTSNGLRHGRYPQRSHAQKMAQVLRRVADDLEA
ncbi:MAG: cold shock domain-containing protein [Micrococcus sp.]|nr:cold shock domain-containing protein [Micrococcus sp.]